MSVLIIHPSGPLRGTAAVPGDKSISHRALLLSALAEGDSTITGWVDADVCQATLRCVRALGGQVDQHDASTLTVRGAGLGGLREPADVLDCAGSGTTIRLIAGILAGQPFTSVLTGSDALRRRPMGRVADPLRLMGATVLGRQDGKLLPLTIRGGNLHGIDYAMPVASAQVKSAILLAGLFATGETIVREPGPARDHTERMLAHFGVEVQVEAEAKGTAIRLMGGQKLAGGGPLDVPADFSSAAFPLVAGVLVPDSDLRLRGVGVNPTRTGLFDLLAEMGGDLEMDGGRRMTDHTPSPVVGRRSSSAGEPMADLTARASALRAVEVGGEVVVRAIDEFPIFAVAATQAAGVTVVRDAAELRVKESDRIGTVCQELRKLGAEVAERPDGMVIRGPTPLKGAVVDSHHDHRLAMALAIAALIADGPTEVLDAGVIHDSFPNFVEMMQALGAKIAWAEGGE
jgi:3-phosphoshikimate 1-carboxyvinyltransferase